METLLLLAIIKNDVKAPRHGDYELVEFLVGMAAPLGSAGDVIKVIDAADIKRNMLLTLDEGQVAASVFDLWKLDNPAVTQEHSFLFLLDGYNATY